MNKTLNENNISSDNQSDPIQKALRLFDAEESLFREDLFWKGLGVSSDDFFKIMRESDFYRHHKDQIENQVKILKKNIYVTDNDNLQNSKTFRPIPFFSGIKI